MNPEMYTAMAGVEDRHWWFCGRRSIARRAIADLALPKNADILDVGCGTGGNLAMLSQAGNLKAMELNDAGRAMANSRGIVRAEPGRLPDALPFQGTQFDLITLFDVLEHVEDDKASLAALYARLKPGGHLLLTVPAFMFLWSEHDTLNHHHRRYTWLELGRRLQEAGFTLTLLSYYNFFLFPAAALVRILSRFQKPSPAPRDIGLTIPPAPLNALLTALFAAEYHLLKRVRLPFGLSIIAIAQKSPPP